MKRIGILTAGGDTPALNSTVYGAVVRSNQLKIEIYGFIKGFNCFFNPRVPHVHLNPLFQSIPELDPRPGWNKSRILQKLADQSPIERLIRSRLDRGNNVIIEAGAVENFCRFRR